MKKPKPKKVAVFDIDGTLFRNSLLIELHWKLIKSGIFPDKVRAEIDDYYWAWVNREGSYQSYLEKIIETFEKYIEGRPRALIKGVAKSVVSRQSKIVYVYTRELIKKLKKDHILIALSGSPAVMVEEFARQWHFDHSIGTQFEIVRGKYTGKVLYIPAKHKEKTLKEFLKENNLPKKASIGVGDTETDIGIFNVVEKVICFNPNSKLYRIAKKKGWKVVVERKDVIYEL